MRSITRPLPQAVLTKNKMANKIHLRPRAVIISACVALLIIFSFAAFRSFSELRGQAVAPAREVNKESSKSEAKPSTALSVSNTSSALELSHNIARAIDESEFAKARWGVFVMSLRDGRVLYARDADKAFAPASNVSTVSALAV